MKKNQLEEEKSMRSSKYSISDNGSKGGDDMDGSGSDGGSDGEDSVDLAIKSSDLIVNT